MQRRSKRRIGYKKLSETFELKRSEKFLQQEIEAVMNSLQGTFKTNVSRTR